MQVTNKYFHHWLIHPLFFSAFYSFFLSNTKTENSQLKIRKAKKMLRTFLWKKIKNSLIHTFVIKVVWHTSINRSFVCQLQFCCSIDVKHAFTDFTWVNRLQIIEQIILSLHTVVLCLWSDISSICLVLNTE